MKTKSKLFQARMFCALALGIGSSFSLSATAADSADTAPAKTSIPWSQLGVPQGGTGADYEGDGLAVIATADGAHGVTRPTMLVVLVNDAEAVYPVRIDPTFSDANWISMGGFLGADGAVNAAVVDGSGNLYIGGYFTVVRDVFANNIAKWNGSAWSALGSGVNGSVSALAVSGTDLYAGGFFGVAKWDGNGWSAFNSGLNRRVSALAVSGTNLYVGGLFTTAGGAPANYVAKWDGSGWSAL